VNPLRTLFLIAAALGLSCFPCVSEQEQPALWDASARRAGLRFMLRSNGRDEIIAEITNASDKTVTTEIPAGLVCKLAGPDGGKVVTLRAAPMTIAAGGSVEFLIPAAALSGKIPAAMHDCTTTGESARNLAPLLAWLALHPDVPRSTAQLAVLSLMEDITFPQWRNFLLAAQPNPAPAGQPAAAEIVQAVDALGILREVAPGKSPALATDAELKLRALRNPTTRAKAMQLYGITLPADDTGAAIAPEIGQLLHLVPGDNCPVCRARARMQPPPDVP